MSHEGFEWSVEELSESYYKGKAIDDEKESKKYYPGLTELDFDMYSFKLT